MPRVALLCASLLCACGIRAAPTLLRPPFGPDPDKPEAARFFFPTGAAVDPSGSWLVVSNSNADRLYDAGAMYSLRIADLDKLAGTVPFPAGKVVGAAITGNYTRPTVLAVGTAYAGPPETNRVKHGQPAAATG